jgi:hypothetical protein
MPGLFFEGRREVLQLRCSQLPLAFKCPGSVDRDAQALRVDQISDPAELGTAVHAVLAQVITDNMDGLPNLSVTAGYYGIDDADELVMLCWFGLKAWKELGPKYFIQPQTEAELEYTDEEQIELTGHLDVYAPSGTACGILDWKSGRLDINAYHQMAAYAFLASKDCAAEEFTAAVVMLREQSYRTYRWTHAQLDDWYAKLISEVVNWDGTYHVGEHCRYCGHSLTCEARRAMVRSTVAELEVATAGGAPTELGPQLVSLYRRAKVVRGMLEAFDAHIRAQVSAHGPLDTGDGAKLCLVESFADEIQALQAWHIINRELAAEELAPAIKVSKTRLLDAIGAKNPRGMKGKAQKALMEELEAAGAVKHNPRETLKEIKNSDAQE